jgi:hypothetical protein
MRLVASLTSAAPAAALSCAVPQPPWRRAPSSAVDIRSRKIGGTITRVRRGENGLMGVVDLHHAADQQLAMPAIVGAERGGKRVAAFGAVFTEALAPPLRKQIEFRRAGHSRFRQGCVADSRFRLFQTLQVGGGQCRALLGEAGIEVDVVALAAHGEGCGGVSLGRAAMVKPTQALSRRIGGERAVTAASGEILRERPCRLAGRGNARYPRGTKFGREAWPGGAGERLQAANASVGKMSTPRSASLQNPLDFPVSLPQQQRAHGRRAPAFAAQQNCRICPEGQPEDRRGRFRPARSARFG